MDIKSQFHEIMRNPCEFDIYLRNAFGYATLRLSKEKKRKNCLFKLKTFDITMSRYIS